MADTGRPHIRSGFLITRLAKPLVRRLGAVPALTVRGRQSGRRLTVPLGEPLEFEGARHLVSFRAFTLGALAAIASFVGGLVLVGPSVAEQTAVPNELVTGDGVPTEGQRQRPARAERPMQLATRIDLPLILLAGLMMAVARYL